jgi:hypothetical protein
VTRSCSPALHARIERWLEPEGVFTILGFGDVELAGELDWEPGAGPVYLRRLGRPGMARRHHGDRPPGRARGGRHAAAVSRRPCLSRLVR